MHARAKKKITDHRDERLRLVYMCIYVCAYSIYVCARACIHIHVHMRAKKKKSQITGTKGSDLNVDFSTAVYTKRFFPLDRRLIFLKKKFGGDFFFILCCGVLSAQ